MAEKILAVDDNQINLKIVSTTLEQAGFEVYTAENGLTALEMAEKISPVLIILDINMPEMDGYEVCRRLRKKKSTSNIPIVMLTANDTLEEKIKGFEAGADEYLTKPFQVAELQARIMVLLRRMSRTETKLVSTTSKVIAVFSLRGGLGVSTIAGNLSAGLSQIWKQSVVLVDLALTMGQSALMLNLPLRNTWADLSKMPAGEIDSEVVKNVLLTHASGVSVLAAPRRSVEGESVSPEIVSNTIEVLRSNFSYVVLDLPHDFRETTLVGLDSADEIVLLMAPELASVRATGEALEVFDNLGYPRNKIKIVMNWVFERKGLARKDIENVLKHPVKFVLPFIPDTFVSAINLGVPPVIGEPTSAVGALLEDFSYALSKVEDRKNFPENPSEALLRIRERSKSRR